MEYSLSPFAPSLQSQLPVSVHAARLRILTHLNISSCSLCVSCQQLLLSPSPYFLRSLDSQHLSVDLPIPPEFLSQDCQLVFLSTASPRYTFAILVVLKVGFHSAFLCRSSSNGSAAHETKFEILMLCLKVLHTLLLDLFIL